MEQISLNFGAIKDTVKRLSSWELSKESKSNTLNSFLQEVRNRPALMKQHLIYKNFTDCKNFAKGILAERYIAQNLNIFKGTNWFDILLENKGIRIKLLENHHVESDGTKNNLLYESVHTLIESVTKPGFSDTERQQHAYDFLLEYLTRKQGEILSEEKNENPSLKDWKFVTKLAVGNFNKRYSHLEEDERKILNMILSEDDKKINYIEDLRLENIKIIDKMLGENKDSEKQKVLLEFKEKLDIKQELTLENYNDYLINYFELNKALGEIA